MVSFYVEVKREKEHFITVISNEKWYKIPKCYKEER